MLKKIVSGGQTGVDRAALDAAVGAGLEHGGWCPLGRIAEDGVIPARYALKETPEAHVDQRTEWNVRDSDGTLILHNTGLDRGTKFTAEAARSRGKPLLMIRMDTGEPAVVARWIEENGIEVLNIAGPRESSAPGTYRAARAWLTKFLG